MVRWDDGDSRTLLYVSIRETGEILIAAGRAVTGHVDAYNANIMSSIKWIRTCPLEVVLLKGMHAYASSMVVCT